MVQLFDLSSGEKQRGDGVRREKVRDLRFPFGESAVINIYVRGRRFRPHPLYAFLGRLVEQFWMEVIERLALPSRPPFA
jgi:hypothetical protein